MAAGSRSGRQAARGLGDLVAHVDENCSAGEVDFAAMIDQDRYRFVAVFLREASAKGVESLVVFHGVRSGRDALVVVADRGEERPDDEGGNDDDRRGDKCQCSLTSISLIP